MPQSARFSQESLTDSLSRNPDKNPLIALFHVIVVWGNASHVKRTAARSTLLLLFSMTIGVQLIAVALANFKPSPYPGTPDTSKPSIKIQEPYPDKSYNAKSVAYNITVENPASWYNAYGERYAGELLFLGYTLDGKKNVTIAPIENQNASRYIYDPTGKFFIPNPDYVELPSSQSFTFKGNFSELSEGSHTVQFWAYAVSRYTPEEERNTFLYPVYKVYTYAASDTVSFYVTNQEEGTEARLLTTGFFTFLLVATVSVAVAAVVVVAVLVCWKKRKR